MVGPKIIIPPSTRANQSSDSEKRPKAWIFWILFTLGISYTFIRIPLFVVASLTDPSPGWGGGISIVVCLAASGGSLWLYRSGTKKNIAFLIALGLAIPAVFFIVTLTGVSFKASDGTLTILMIFVPLGFGVLAILGWFVAVGRSKRNEPIIVAEGHLNDDLSIPREGDAAYSIPPPEVPQELVDAFLAGECVLYGGAGLSAQAGLPTWTPLLSQMVEWAINEHVVDERAGRSLRGALLHGETESVSEGLLDLIGPDVDRLHKFLEDTLLQKGTPSPLHRTISRLPFGAVLTTNLDELLENSFEQGLLPVYTPRDTEALLTALSTRAFFILKLYGSLRSGETIILSAAQYEESVALNRAFSSFMETLFFSRTIFFIGARLESIEDYLKGIKFSQTRPRTHYALVDVTATGPAWELKSNTLYRRYGIKVIPYKPTDAHPEVRKFVDALVAAVESAKRLKPTAVAAAPAKGALKRMILDDIGPFEHLELNLDPGWNVLLGDNGVGKTNILKALAIAICGHDAQAYANRLIRAGKTSGSIILETDRGSIYKTELKLGSVEAEVVSTPGRPLEAEGWLAIGFPPSRIFSWDKPKSPEARVELRRPNPEDLLPLIQGASDPRMDRLKQWLLNLDYWAKDAREKKENAQRFEDMRNDFFDIGRKLAFGTNLQDGGIDTSYEVKVTMNDVTLPLAAISQGTAALLGWIGILLQRLYEVPDAGTTPRQRYALVLIDELDAHMHPAWQQALIPHLKEIFPNIQFLATTHSPFLAVGRRASEIVRLARDPATGKVRGEAVEHDTKKMGIANVLTSYLFGLKSPLDYDLQRDLQRKRRLSIKAELTPEERDELAMLSERLEDVDAVSMFRDPLYKLFVDEMTRREQLADGEVGKVTKESEQRQLQLTKEILDKLVREREGV